MDTCVLGIMIPLLGTVLGASAVFLMKKALSATVGRILLGFAAGVMLAASVWSLVLPAIEMAEEQGVPGWIPAAVGFLIGVAFLLLLDAVTPLLRKKSDADVCEKRKSLLLLAVTLHNIPEGMAVGVVFAGFLSGNGNVTAAGAFALAFGIAVQNIPEGAIISAPLLTQGVTRPRAFWRGVLSGIVEPIGAFLTLALASLITPVLPYILSFAAGAMVYVAAGELIPEAQSGSRVGLRGTVGTVSIACGFVLMMLLDVLLG